MRGRPFARDGAIRQRRLPRWTSTTWRLALITAGLLAAAFNTGNNLVYLMFSLLAAGLPVSWILGGINLRRIDCSTRLPRAPRVDSPFAIDVELVVRRRRPALRSVEVALLTDRGVLGPVLVERVGAGERGRVTLNGRGDRRGPLRVRGVVLRSVFPFGFLRHERIHERSEDLLILPSIRRAATRTGRIRVEGGSRALSAQVVGCEYTGLRRGTDEDDVRKVDWKVTARRGLTIVRETAGEAGRAVTLSVSTRCFGPPGEARERFERQVSTVAGQAQRALESGETVHLVVDGERGRTYSGRGAVLRVLRRLARLTPTGEDGTPLPWPQVEPGAGATVEETNRPAVRGAARTHRASNRLALTIGVTALFLSGGIGPMLLTLILGSVLATGFRKGLVTRPGSLASRLWKVASVLALVAYLVDLLLARRDPLGASLGLTVFITLFALYNGRGVRDDRRLLLVAFLHVVLAAALTTEVTIALPLAGWLLATINGLLAWTAVMGSDGTLPRRTVVDTEATRFGLVPASLAAGAAVLCSCLAIFAVVPHLGTGAFRPGMFHRQAVAGFSDTATLGDHGRIKLDRSKVMEVDLSGAPPAEIDLRWRGVALNRFDGRTWSRSYGPFHSYRPDERGRFFVGGSRPDTSRKKSLLTQSVRLEPGLASAVFSAREPRVVVSRELRRLGEDSFGNLELVAKPTRRLSYTVLSDPPTPDAEALRLAAGDDPDEVRVPNSALPPLDPRIRELSRQLTRDAGTRFDAAASIERWLSESLTYSLDVADRDLRDPLASFLFDGMPGHCEYFATAMVVLAREAGIPARFVAGYLRGEKSTFGNRYVVRQSDAHAWVEVYFPGAGWMPFDPTPPIGRQVVEAGGLASLVGGIGSWLTRLWDDYLVGIDLDDQARGLLALTSAVNALGERLRAVWHPLWVVAALVAIVAIVRMTRHVRRAWRRSVFRGSSRARSPELPAFYRSLAEMLARRGLSRRPGETPAELAARARTLIPARGADRVDELTRLYYRVRFDGSTRERNVSRIAHALLTDVRNVLT